MAFSNITGRIGRIRTVRAREYSFRKTYLFFEKVCNSLHTDCNTKQHLDKKCNCSLKLKYFDQNIFSKLCLEILQIIYKYKVYFENIELYNAKVEIAEQKVIFYREFHEEKELYLMENLVREYQKRRVFEKKLQNNDFPEPLPNK